MSKAHADEIKEQQTTNNKRDTTMRQSQFQYGKAIQQHTAQGQASKTGPVRIVGPRRIKVEVAQ